MSINTLLLCARCIDQTGHAKKNNNGLAEPLLLLLVVFLEGTRLFSYFSLAFTLVKELEVEAKLPAINFVIFIKLVP